MRIAYEDMDIIGVFFDLFEFGCVSLRHQRLLGAGQSAIPMDGLLRPPLIV
jgi:hypothetical protein